MRGENVSRARKRQPIIIQICSIQETQFMFLIIWISFLNNLHNFCFVLLLQAIWEKSQNTGAKIHLELLADLSQLLFCPLVIILLANPLPVDHGRFQTFHGDDGINKGDENGIVGPTGTIQANQVFTAGELLATNDKGVENHFKRCEKQLIHVYKQSNTHTLSLTHSPSIWVCYSILSLSVTSARNDVITCNVEISFKRKNC